MEFNPWLIALVVGVVAMIFGPVMMLQPSPAQRNLETIRKRAMSMGLQVNMRPLPKMPTDNEAPSMTAVYQRLSPCAPDEHRDWLLIRSTYQHEMNLAGDWAWYKEGRPQQELQVWLDNHLRSLPPSIVAVGANLQGYYVYWKETGGDAAFEKLTEFLKTIPS